ncbi:TetR family transcriptional regulator [Micromonospora sp. NPDC050417]|uniref:acyl-CoA-like ligand-binding transcription factor n=1 Tax=Micromonospora sp. NPDC050417 TaxID=3364280 RepID=UPI0037895E5F
MTSSESALPTAPPAATAPSADRREPHTDPPANRRERKKLETRAALEQAALRLFGEKGYEHTTVEEIAAEADVAVRTFFRYFASKQHVLFGDVAHQRINHLRAALAASPPDETPLQAISSVLNALDLDEDEQKQISVRLRLLERQPTLISMYLMLNHRLRQTIVEFVAARTGLSPWHPYPLLLAGAAVTSWDTALHAWLADDTATLADLRRQAYAVLTAGIPADPPAPAGPTLSRPAGG